MAAVELSGLYKNYGTVEVIKGVDLTIRDGEFVVLVGPSGCGKSTLLRMIAGLESVTSGTVAIDGRVVNQLEPRERNIAMVFQSYALYPHMSVNDNMAFSLRLRRVPKPEIEQQVGEAARILGLRGLLDRRPRQLSGGQRQRVAMGRAIVRAPSVFLFDEPLSNLDARLRVQTRVEIRELHDRLGATSIFVTHDQVEAMTLADRIVLLDRGTIQQVGSPLELYRTPANVFVATFIGSPEMNLFPARLSETAGAAVAELPVAGRSLNLDPQLKASAGTDILIGCRPEDMRLVAPNTAEADFTGEVLTVEHLGPETHVYVRVGGQRVCASARDTVSVSPRQQVGLALQPGRIHVFNEATSERLAA